MAYVGLGASRPAVATMCPPGEIMTRDGCEPSTPEAEETHVECGPGTEYHAPTDSCRPVDCPEGEMLAQDGTCVPEECPPGYERGPGGRCEPVEEEAECPEGMFRDEDGRCVDVTVTEGHPIDEPMELTITDTDESSSETTVDPGGGTLPQGSGGGPPAAWASTPPDWWTQEAPEPAEPPEDEDEPGFGLVQAAMAAAVGIIMHRAITDRRSS